MLIRNRAHAGWVIAIALAFVVLGCSDNGDDGPDVATAPTLVSSEGTTPESGPPDVTTDAPPPTTVSAGGSRVEMRVGTYCWTTLCVDKIGPITRGTLRIASGDEVVVAVPDGTPPLNEVTVQAFPAGTSEEFDNGETAWMLDYSFDGTMQYERDDEEVRIVVTQEPGMYILVVGMFFDPGDVQYGVVLEVE